MIGSSQGYCRRKPPRLTLLQGSSIMEKHQLQFLSHGKHNLVPQNILLLRLLYLLSHPLLHITPIPKPATREQTPRPTYFHAFSQCLSHLQESIRAHHPHLAHLLLPLRLHGHWYTHLIKEPSPAHAQLLLFALFSNIKLQTDSEAAILSGT